jgi:hypothetical protein
MSTNAAAADSFAGGTGAAGEDPKQVVASLNRRLGRESRWLSGNDAYFRAYIYEAATEAFDLLDVAVKAKVRGGVEGRRRRKWWRGEERDRQTEKFLLFSLSLSLYLYLCLCLHLPLSVNIKRIIF